MLKSCSLPLPPLCSAIGLEYEYVLQEKLHNLGITFKGT